jgi:hypothetical protein
MQPLHPSFLLLQTSYEISILSYAPRGHRRRRVATSPFPHHHPISLFCNRAVADTKAASSQFPSKLPFLNAQNKFNRWILSTEPKAKGGKKRRRRRTRTRKEGRGQPRDTNTNAFPERASSVKTPS